MLIKAPILEKKKKGGEMGPQGEKIKHEQNKAKHTELFFLWVFSLRAKRF